MGAQSQTTRPAVQRQHATMLLLLLLMRLLAALQ